MTELLAAMIVGALLSFGLGYALGRTHFYGAVVRTYDEAIANRADAIASLKRARQMEGEATTAFEKARKTLEAAEMMGPGAQSDGAR